MSCVYKGNIIDSELSENARGGTELMRERFVNFVPRELQYKVAVHFSRVRKLYSDVKNIMYCHDLASDPETEFLHSDGHQSIDHFVFVSCWQRDQYLIRYNIPYSKTSVIENACSTLIQLEEYNKGLDRTGLHFIYHTTPHRGLDILYEIFDKLYKEFGNKIHLNIFSSFDIYGWPQRNESYKELFDRCSNHPGMTYSPSVSHEQIQKELAHSDIFLYPSIWPETSCLALIEAMKSGLVCIHSNLGALPETSRGNTHMYDITENRIEHIQRAYEKTVPIVTKMINRNYFSGYSNLHDFTYQAYTQKWIHLLTKI